MLPAALMLIARLLMRAVHLEPAYSFSVAIMCTYPTCCPAASCRGGTWRGLLFRVPAFLPRGSFGAEAACYGRCMYAEVQKSSQQAQARFRVCSWYVTCLWLNLVSRGAGRRLHRFAIRAAIYTAACPFCSRFVHAQHRQYVRGLPVTAAGQGFERGDHSREYSIHCQI